MVVRSVGAAAVGDNGGGAFAVLFVKAHSGSIVRPSLAATSISIQSFSCSRSPDPRHCPELAESTAPASSGKVDVRCWTWNEIIMEIGNFRFVLDSQPELEALNVVVVAI